jgi:hypothetical protein
MSKIAVFYMIGQYSPRWKEDFFDNQMSLLYNTGLHDEIKFIEIFVKGDQPLSALPSKVNNLTYLGDIEEERSYHRKLYRAYNYIQQRIWCFAQANPDYKVLFFHSLGVSRSDPTVLKYKLKWKDYMETLLIKNWKQCVDLLDHYDCVGTEYIPFATYKEETIQFEAPHYQGFFWWANTNYLRKLDPTYFYQDVEWQPYLCELWIGSGKPKAYNFYTSWLNHYMHEINPPYEEILNSSTQHLKELNNEL